MVIVLFACLLAVGFAQPPIWYPGGQCGRSKYSDAGDMDLPTGTIVGGQKARPFEFPWQVSIRWKFVNKHFCGGSIINDRWIVTAAHCLDEEIPVTTSVVVGEHDRSAETNPVRACYDVARIFVHESYNSRTHENDIALIKTVFPIAINSNVRPICAPDPANDYHYHKSQCSGWGDISPGGSSPKVLRYVTLNVTTNAFCEAAYNKQPIYPDMVCASDNSGSNDRDSCQGDSGGPLSVKDSSGIFSLIGVVSWGYGCASGYPGVYCRVGSYIAWINNKIYNN